ncbi:hypothetical protein APHAL10511_003443 [Amanita phalloides]|nr:hypothetical protein APHAL10511_003443 [Amanita phalloides]
MVFSKVVGLSTLLLGAVGAIADGVFPPVLPGALGNCGPLPTDAACSTVFVACNKTLTNINDPFSNEACVAAASCYPGRPNDFLYGIDCYLTGRKEGGGPTSTLSIPRVSSEVYDKIAINGDITYDSYNKWFTGVAIAADPGADKLIDIALIRINWDIIAGWTGFCSTNTIPKQNFLDWFQYSSTAGGTTGTCGTVGDCPLSIYPYHMDLLIPCTKYSNALTNPFSIQVCVAAALNWDTGVDSFLQGVACRYNLERGTNETAPASNSLPALSVDIAPNSPYSQQDFVDFAFGALSSIHASVRWPTVGSWVTTQWAGIVKWTNFCGASVPKKNLSDFLHYSHYKIGQNCPRVCGQDSNPGCQQLFRLCTSRSSFINPWNERTCILAATCYNGGIQTFASDYSCEEGTTGKDAQPQNFPRLQENVWGTLDNPTTGVMGTQDYIRDVTDALNGTANLVPSTSYLTSKWSTISKWAGFSSGEVPFSNFADWLQDS